MKATLKTDLLQKKLSFLQHGVSSRAQLPILLHLLLEVSGSTLTIKSTDLEIGIETSIQIESGEDGGVTVPAKPFVELLATISDDIVVLDAQEGSFHVSTKRTKSVFQTSPKDEFPRLYNEKGIKIATLPSEQFRQELSYVVFAASTDTTRINLSGVLLKPEEGGFLLVATDGYRLSLKKSTKGEGVSLNDATLLIPARVFRELLALHGEGDMLTIYIAKEQNQVIFEQQDTLLVGRLIDATFPTYEKIIPADVATTSMFDKDEMLKAVRMCSIFARDAANIVKFSLRKDKVVVSSQAASLGENTVEVEAKLIGEENEIAFNARYVLDVLGNLDKNDLSFEMTGPLNPGVFKIQGDSTFLHLIMPIRVQG